METYKLKKPIQFEGKEIKELQLDFDSLIRADIDRAEKIYKLKEGNRGYISEVDKKYQIIIISFASGLPLEAFNSLGAKDYTQLCMAAYSFLALGELEDEEAKDEELESLLKQTRGSGKTQTLPQPKLIQTK